VISRLDSPRALGCTCVLVDLCKSSLIFEKNASFLGIRRGFSPCGPQGRVDSEEIGSILPSFYERML
jgi:hypothetical protein